LGFDLPCVKEKVLKRAAPVYKILNDQAGEYVKLNTANKNYYMLTPEQLPRRVDGKLSEMNHAGINIGPKVVSRNKYLSIRKNLSRASNLYRYPTGEEWPFIIPATEKRISDRYCQVS
jgi:hypothetical protein